MTCPALAAYRVDTTYAAGGTARAPETWVYYDVLARAVLCVQQGFTATQYKAMSKDYDELGRLADASEPYFTYAPTLSTVGNANGGSIYKTTTGYDVLGRVTSITHPNSSLTKTVYSGLNATTTLPANASGIAEVRRKAKTFWAR